MANEIKWTPDIVPSGGIDESQSSRKIAPDHWSAGKNVEPMPDGVRSRTGSATVNSQAILAVDQSHEDGTDDRETLDGTTEFISQGFQLTNAIDAGEPMYVAVRMKKVNSPTANVDLAIYADDGGGEPGVVVSGNGFSSFNSIDSATLTAEYKWYYFKDSSLFTGLTAATQYHFIIRYTGGPTNEIALEEDTASGSYAGTDNHVHYSDDLATWSAVTAADLNFRIYGPDAVSTITAIADYKLSDGTAERHLLVAGGEVYKQSGGTITEVSTRERASLTHASTVYPSWVVGNDRWFMTNDTDIPKKFYILSATEYWENEGIAAPTATPAATHPTGGSLASGTYEVDYRYVNEDINQLSDSRYGGVSALSVGPIATNDQIAITGLPTAVVRENDRATHIQIEVKFPGATTFRRVARQALDGVTSTYNLTSDTRTLDAEYIHAVPPIHKVKAVANNRQFILNVDGSPWRLQWSAISGTTPYYESFPAIQFRDFGRGEGDEGTALAYVPPRTLIVGFRNSIWALDSRIPGTSDPYLISRNIGIANHNAWVVVNQQLFFVSNSDKHKGMYRWRGKGEPEVLREIQTTFRGVNQTRLDKVSCVPLTPDENRFQWWTLCSGSGQNEHDTILVYDWKLEAFTVYERDSAQTVNVLGAVESGGTNTVYMGDYDGIEWQADSGTQDDSTDFTSQATLGNLDFGIPQDRKRLRFIDYVAEEKTTGSIGVSVETDDGVLTGTFAQISSGTAFTLDTSKLGGPHVLGGTGETTGRVAFHGSSRRFKPTFSSVNSFYLRGVTFGVQQQGRRK